MILANITSAQCDNYPSNMQCTSCILRFNRRGAKWSTHFHTRFVFFLICLTSFDVNVNIRINSIGTKEWQLSMLMMALGWLIKWKKDNSLFTRCCVCLCVSRNQFQFDGHFNGMGSLYWINICERLLARYVCGWLVYFCTHIYISCTFVCLFGCAADTGRGLCVPVSSLAAFHNVCASIKRTVISFFFEPK